MPGLVPGIHAFLRIKAWMAGTSPAMTLIFGSLNHRYIVCCYVARNYVACCGVIWCTSPDFRSIRMRLILSRLTPVTRTKRDLSG